MFFSYFCTKYRLRLHVITTLIEADLMSIHNLCFIAKLENNVYPCAIRFYNIKVGCKGSTLHGLVSMMKDFLRDNSFVSKCVDDFKGFNPNEVNK